VDKAKRETSNVIRMDKSAVLGHSKQITKMVFRFLRRQDFRSSIGILMVVIGVLGAGLLGCADKECVRNSECLYGTACFRGECRPLCQEHSQCPASEACTSGVCYPGPRPTQDSGIIPELGDAAVASDVAGDVDAAESSDSGDSGESDDAAVASDVAGDVDAAESSDDSGAPGESDDAAVASDVASDVDAAESSDDSGAPGESDDAAVASDVAGDVDAAESSDDSGDSGASNDSVLIGSGDIGFLDNDGG